MSIIFYLMLAAISTVVVWRGAELIDDSSERLGSYYRLPIIVRGALIAAIGSSFPELSSAVLATLLHGEFALGVSAIVGSAIFNILVIPGAAAIATRRTGLQASKDLVFKDAQFYAVSVCTMVIIFMFAQIYHPVPGTTNLGQLTVGLAVVPLFVYVLYVFLQAQDYSESLAGSYHTDIIEGVVAKTEWMRFGMGVLLTVLSVEGLVFSGIEIGHVLGVPSFIWGLTVLAAATSLPDLKISMDAARRGEGDLCMANVLGSNIFDLLVCIPAGVLPAILLFGSEVTVNYEQIIPMMAILLLATIVLFVFLRTGLALVYWEGLFLLAMYGCFVALVIAETTGGSNFLNAALPTG